ncbi:MAG: V-type ATPase subunit, partial [Deltaproteobacteria bacterium]|nr:V-type ATPase subunit [Deltaproteobacteria bacterium]
MASPLSKYALINAKLRARISKILPEEHFRELAKAPSLEAALALLRETPFASLEQIYTETGDLKLAERELLKSEIELYQNIRRYLHQRCQPLVDALLTQFEIENLKNAIRLYFDRKFRKRPVDNSIHYILYEPVIHAIPMDIIVNAEGFEEIVGACEGTPYSQIIKKFYHTVEAEDSLFRLEIGLDHYYYSNLLSAIDTLDPQDRTVASRLISIEIDLQNISWIIRFKDFYQLPLEAVLTNMIPGGLNLNRDVIDELYRAQNVTTVLQGMIAGKYPGLSALLASQTSSNTARLT